MTKLNMLKPFVSLVAVATILSACSSSEGSETHDESKPHAHAEEAVSTTKALNGGKILEEGNFALEITIEEAGQAPEFRLFAYENGKIISPSQVDAEVVLTRLDGEVNTFNFASNGKFLFGDTVVTEPHSFDVMVKAKYKGRSYNWAYGSYEGRTKINSEMAKEAGIETAAVGPAEIEQTLDILGQIEFAPSGQSTLRARFPGKVMKVFKSEGEQVKKGEVLARIESNESLQTYAVTSPMDGVIVNSHTREGDVVTDGELFIIGDVTNLWADFHIYPGDMRKVRPGQKVRIEPISGGFSKVIELDEYLPATEPNSQTLTIHAPFKNPEKLWLPGMKITGTVTIEKAMVPLAVKSDAIQRFRNFSVVFAQIGGEYEVRMLDIGRKNGEWTEVLGGIKTGQQYVTKNSFTIKADIEKSGASHDH